MAIKWLFRLTVGVVTLIVLTGYAGQTLLHNAFAAGSSSWIDNTQLSVAELQDLPDNQSLSQSNFDCTQTSFTLEAYPKDVTTSGCLVRTAFGEMGVPGSPAIFNGTSNAVSMHPYISALSLMPIPNQQETVSLNYNAIPGAYIGFYRNFVNYLTKSSYYTKDGAWNVDYSINKGPDFSLYKDPNHKTSVNMLSVNPNAMAFSENGDWLMVNAMGVGFVRVNLATFDMLPFAPQIPEPGTRMLPASITISNDGRYAAVAYTNQSYGQPYFTVYDLATCAAPTSDVLTGPLSCKSRDVWPYLSSQQDIKYVTNVRFVNDDDISFDGVYNWKSSSDFKAAKFAISDGAGSVSGLQYLAIGDSYISGEGTFDYEQGTDDSNNKCHLSARSYPYIIGQDLFGSYKSVACSGAVTDDITDESLGYTGQVNLKVQKQYRDIDSILANFEPGYIDQLDFVKKYRPNVITISIGGNNIGFAGILKTCALPPIHTYPISIGSSTCYNTYDERLELVNAIDGQYGYLKGTYEKLIEEAAPNTKVYAIGYPQIATEGNCADNVHLNSGEIQFSEQLITYLDSVIERAAKSAGAIYVDTQHALDGHRLCEAKSFDVAVNGLTAGDDTGPIGKESYHPNALGQELLSRAVMQATNNFKGVRPQPDDSIKYPLVSDPEAHDLLNVSRDGVPAAEQYQEEPDDSIVGDLLVKGSRTTVAASGVSKGLQPNTQYQVVLHSTPEDLGKFTTDADGDLSAHITIPEDVPPGMHTLHIYGTNMANEPIDIYKAVYIAASTTDYDGDGALNADNPCSVVPLSGHDVDRDGIDDACDPFIGEVPVPPADDSGPTVPSESTDTLSPAAPISATPITTQAYPVAITATTSLDKVNSGSVLGDTTSKEAQGSERIDQILHDNQMQGHHTNMILGLVIVSFGAVVIVACIWLIRHVVNSR